MTKLENEAENAKLKESLRKVHQEQNVIPARGILQGCHEYKEKQGIKEYGSEIQDLIHDIIFYYG